MRHKTNFGKHALRQFPLTIFCVLLTWYLCLMRAPSLNMDTFNGFDKCAHICMYLGTCSVFWVEYFRSRLQASRLTLALTAIAAPILMSGIIELAQEYLTTCRSGDWMDFLANSIGVLLALALSPAYRKLASRNR